MFSISLSTRNTFTPLLPPPVAWTVERLTWRAVGGPWAARLRAESPHVQALWQLAGLLRCGLILYDAREAAWWGYLAAVTLHAGGQVIRLSLDGMANQVAVSYRERTPNPWGGARQQTPWTGDAASIALYGEKQRVFDLGASATGSAAAAYAATLLAQIAGPEVTAHAEPAPDAPYATLEGRGWWETLDWRYYSDPRGLEGHQSGGSTAVGVGNQPTAVKAAQSFTLATAEAWSADEAWLKLRRNHAADALRLELRGGDPTAPGEPLLAAASLPAAEISEDLAWTRFALDPPVLLQPGQTYWLVLSRDGAIDAERYAQFAADEGAAAGQGYPRGVLRLWDGSAWAARAPDADMHFQVLGVDETSAQIAHLLGQSPFFSQMRVEAASGVSARVYRDGSRRARGEVETLLQGGTAAGSRLLARVLPDRAVRVYPQPPASQAALALGPGGQILRPDGRALAPGEWPAGQWARLGELAPPGVGADGATVVADGATVVAGATMAAANWLFIEACAWDGRGIHLSQP